MAKTSMLTALALMTLTSVTLASPNSAKMDPRARIALVRLQTGVPAATLRAEATAVTTEGELDVFIRGDVSRSQLEAAGARVRTALPGLFTASVPVSALEAVLALPGVRSVRGSAPVEQELDASVPTTGAHLLRGPGPGFAGGLNGAGILVGDVDSGVDFGHGDFRDGMNNSRLVSLWDQTVGGASPPPAYGYGQEWTNAQLTSGVATEVDTDGHGTHVLGTAGGDGSLTGGAIPAHTYTGMAPLADLIMVKTDFSTTGIVDGVEYVLDKGTSLGKPTVCNLSLGSQFGSHDGTSDFESALSALTGLGRIVVKSAGNDRAVARHAETFATAGPSSITMSVTSSATGRQIAIDGYYESTENLNVTVVTPNGTTVGPVLLGGINAGYPGTATLNGSVYIENGAFLTSGLDREVYIEISGVVTTGANGTWTFTFTPVTVGAALGEVDLWRFFHNGGTANFVLGSQPFEELISEPGNADSVITVAAWVSKQSWIACTGASSTFSGTPAVGSLAQFSSPGPTRDNRQKPDITAPGIAIGSTRSLDIFAACPGAGASTLLPDGINHIVNAGTSMAAPHVTGAAALLMQRYGPLYPQQIKALLTSFAIVDGSTGAVWNRDWGMGKLHIPDIVPPTASVVAPNGGESIEIGTGTTLTWIASDIGSSVTGVDLQLSRSGPGGPFENIALGVPNTGSFGWTTSGAYTANAFLRVTAHDANANTAEDLSDAAFLLHYPADVGDAVIREFSLGRVSPSPTAGAAQMDFALPRDANVRLSIFDIQGREVAVLASGRTAAGEHHVSWDGRFGAKRAPGGLYFVRFKTPDRTLVERLVVAH